MLSNKTWRQSTCLWSFTDWLLWVYVSEGNPTFHPRSTTVRLHQSELVQTFVQCSGKPNWPVSPGPSNCSSRSEKLPCAAKKALIGMARSRDLPVRSLIGVIEKEGSEVWAKGAGTQGRHGILIAIDHFEKWKIPLPISIRGTKATHLHLHFSSWLKMKDLLETAL